MGGARNYADLVLTRRKLSDMRKQNKRLTAERDEARAEAKQWRGELRDTTETGLKNMARLYAARAEVARLRTKYHQMLTIATAQQETGERLALENADLRAEVERLTAERDDAHALLSELADLVDDEDYTPDSFTTQPARALLRQAALEVK